MEHYEEMEEELHEFKKYLKLTMDLLCDSYKWLKLSEYAEDEADKTKYKQVSSSLYDMFMIEHNRIGAMFKGE